MISAFGVEHDVIAKKDVRDKYPHAQQGVAVGVAGGSLYAGGRAVHHGRLARQHADESVKLRGNASSQFNRTDRLLARDSKGAALPKPAVPMETQLKARQVLHGARQLDAKAAKAARDSFAAARRSKGAGAAALGLGAGAVALNHTRPRAPVKSHSYH